MRVLSKSYSLGSLSSASGAQNQEHLSSNFLTRASIAATVTGASGLDGLAKLQGSNALTSTTGQAVAANMEPYFDVPPTSWFDLPGGSVALTANGTVQSSTSFTARWVRAVASVSAGSGTVRVDLHLSNEAA